jgi:SAM-dependent methyltransferase
MGVNAPACRSCGHDGLTPILSLGRLPLANALLSPEQLGGPGDVYPLDLVFCPRCTLVQITETVSPDRLFHNYLYYSSFSDTMVAHAGGLATRLVRERRLGPSSLVVEAGSNDGYLLRHYREAGVGVLGVEPAAAVAEVARTAHGVPTLNEFFGVALARRLVGEGRRAAVFHAHNVLAHVADLNGFVAGIARVLAADGAAVVEVPDVREMVDRGEFDTIYHEHLCYFSLSALRHLFERHGLRVWDVERVPIHGGSLRVYAGRRDAAPEASGRVQALLREEADWGVGRAEPYRALSGRAGAIKEALCGLLADLKGRGKRLAAYGASAKGSVLLNWCGLGAGVLDFVVDRSPFKQGRYMPGVRLPIHAPGRLLEAMPDYVLLLTWNFAQEILAQQADYCRRGGRFIRPVPDVRVLGPAAAAA